MKVVLLKDVARIGRRLDVREVPDGLAQNRLIPQKLALPATPDNLSRAKREVARRFAQKTEAQETFSRTLNALAGAELQIHVPANDRGGLFRTVRAADIAKLVSEQVGPLTAEQVQLSEPIKTVGTHTVDLADAKLTGSVTVVVNPA